jgi:hypothetical protein
LGAFNSAPRHWLLTYSYDLSKSVNKKSKRILFADGTSFIFKSSKSENIKSDINIALLSLNRQFETNTLSLSFDKTH